MFCITLGSAQVSHQTQQATEAGSLLSSATSFPHGCGLYLTGRQPRKIELAVSDDMLTPTRTI
jgi:hypothetical protein